MKEIRNIEEGRSSFGGIGHPDVRNEASLQKET